MSTIEWIFIVVLAIAVVGILAAVLSPRRRAEKLQNQFGREYTRTVEIMGDEKKAQNELLERKRHVEALDIHPLTPAERERYQGEWADVQAKFVEQPGQAIVDADRLIVEVMTLRAYPVADFDQRAADISVNYPALVSHYRSAREIANRNKQGQASTEELRQAMINYRSLFEELLETQAVKES